MSVPLRGVREGNRTMTSNLAGEVGLLGRSKVRSSKKAPALQSKAGPQQWFSLPACLRSKCQLQRQLNHTRRKREVRVGDLAKIARRSRYARRAAAHRPTGDARIGIREVGRVRYVVALGAERKLELLGQREVLENREIRCAPVRAIALRPAFVAGKTDRLLLEGVQVDPVPNRRIRDRTRLAGDHVRAVRGRVGQVDQVLPVNHGERLSRLPE